MERIYGGVVNVIEWVLHSDLLIAHGIVFVKIEHDCKPRQYSFVMEIQKLYENGRMDEAAALQKSILGSEDLNVRTKKVAGKRGTKHEKSTNANANEASLQYADGRNARNVEEPAIMDEQLNENQEIRSPEVVFAKIIENLEKYTNEKLEKVLSNKSKIYSNLNSHRPVKMVGYHFGISGSLKSDERIIVFEWDDRARVREYCRKIERKFVRWECRECHRLRSRGRKLVQRHYLRLVSGIVFVPIKHNCPPRDYRLVMQYQRFLEDGEITKARSMSQTKGFTFGQDLSNINVLDDEPSSLFAIELAQESNVTVSNSVSSSNLKRKIHSDNNNTSLNDKSSVLKKSKLSKFVLNENDSAVICEEARAIKKIKTRKNKQSCEEVLSSVHQIPEADEGPTLTASSTAFAFEKPTFTMLEKICDKLKIQYRNKAMKVWDQIMFKQIDTESPPSTKFQTREFQTENFYSVLSKLFTGKSNHHQQIKEAILEAFRTKVVESGEISSRKFNKLYWKDTVTDRHLSFIAKYIPCRILIFDFDENELRRYGKWKEASRKRITLVLSISDGCYSIILKL